MARLKQEHVRVRRTCPDSEADWRTAPVSFYFTHLEKLGSVCFQGTDSAAKLDAARAEVYAWLEEVLDGTDEGDASRLLST